MATEVEVKLYPDPQPPEYQAEAKETVPSKTAVPEVQHHDKNDDDDDLDSMIGDCIIVAYGM